MQCAPEIIDEFKVSTPDELFNDLFLVSMLEFPLLDPAVLIEDPPDEPELTEIIELGRLAPPVVLAFSGGGNPMNEFRNLGAVRSSIWSSEHFYSESIRFISEKEQIQYRS